MSVGVDFNLEGPRPWHATGSAHFEICWLLSFSVHFDKTWGEAGQDAAAEVDVLPLVLAALGDAANWQARLPDHVHALAILRTTDGTVVDPAGTLVVSQKLVPLGLAIDRYSSATPRGTNMFAITGVTSVTDSLDHDPVTDEFAPAEFFAMSDSDKLSRPSFEQYPSGVAIGGAARLAADDVVAREVAYEQIIVDRVSPGRPVGRMTLGVSRFGDLVRAGAVSRSTLARNSSFTPAAAGVTTADEAFTVVSTHDLRAATARTGLTYAEAVDQLRALTAATPGLVGTLQIVTASEVAA